MLFLIVAKNALVSWANLSKLHFLGRCIEVSCGSLRQTLHHTCFRSTAVAKETYSRSSGLKVATSYGRSKGNVLPGPPTRAGFEYGQDSRILDFYKSVLVSGERFVLGRTDCCESSAEHTRNRGTDLRGEGGGRQQCV